jgi:hypothetical protein
MYQPRRLNKTAGWRRDGACPDTTAYGVLVAQALASGAARGGGAEGEEKVDPSLLGTVERCVGALVAMGGAGELAPALHTVRHAASV